MGRYFTSSPTATLMQTFLSIALLLTLSGCDALLPSVAQSPGRFRSVGVRSANPSRVTMGVGLYYSTSTGNTENVAYLADAIGVEAKDIGDATNEELEAADALIIGAPTWHT